MARLFMEVLFHYRDKRNYFLHEFVLMPDHFHLLVSPTLSLERSLQLIKGDSPTEQRENRTTPEKSGSRAITTAA